MTPRRILGVDPGSRRTGYGIIDLDKAGATRHVYHGCLMLGSGDMAGRLASLYRGLDAVLEEYQPQVVAVESVFMSKNANSAFKLGQARGVVLCTAAMRELEVAEYSPTEIKKAIVGRGRAEKGQVQHMVAMLLGVRGDIQEDAADALGVALSHAHTAHTRGKMGVTA